MKMHAAMVRRMRMVARQAPLAWRCAPFSAAATVDAIPEHLRHSVLQPPTGSGSAAHAGAVDEDALSSLLGGAEGALDAERAVYAPAIKVRFPDDQGRIYVTGKKKRAIARVWLSRGSGSFTVNGKPMSEYFCGSLERDNTLAAFGLTKTHGMFDVKCTVQGGGIVGQSHAVRHGVSTALRYMEPALRPLLKKAGYLTRDPRIVERKKPGLKKARKAKQWVKR